MDSVECVPSSQVIARQGDGGILEFAKSLSVVNCYQVVMTTGLRPKLSDCVAVLQAVGESEHWCHRTQETYGRGTPFNLRDWNHG